MHSAMNPQRTTSFKRLSPAYERKRVEQKRAKGGKHVSQACDGCRSRKRACSTAQLLQCNECGFEHEFCERCIVENVHCHFPPPEADGRRTSNKQLVTELEIKVVNLETEVERLRALARRNGINPDAGPSPLTVAIPENTYQYRADSMSPSPSPQSLVSPGSSSFPSSASPQSAAPDNSHFLAVPTTSPTSRRTLKQSTSLSNIKSQAALLGSPSMLEPRLPLSANSSPLTQMRDLSLGHARSFSNPEMDSTLASFSNPEMDNTLAFAAQYHAMSMHHGGLGLEQQTTQGLGLALCVPTVHFHPASPAASPPAPAPAQVFVPAATANQHQPALDGMMSSFDPSMWTPTY